jgi:hypothetical protein
MSECKSYLLPDLYRQTLHFFAHQLDAIQFMPDEGSNYEKKNVDDQEGTRYFMSVLRLATLYSRQRTEKEKNTCDTPVFGGAYLFD